MAGSSVPIIRGGSSAEYLAGNASLLASVVVINLELKQVDIYEKLPRNQRICSFCNSNKSENENHFLLDCKAYSKISDVFFSKIELKLPNFKSLSHDTLIAHHMNSSDYLSNCRLVLFISQ